MSEHQFSKEDLALLLKAKELGLLEGVESKVAKAETASARNELTSIVSSEISAIVENLDQYVQDVLDKVKITITFDSDNLPTVRVSTATGTQRGSGKVEYQGVEYDSTRELAKALGLEMPAAYGWGVGTWLRRKHEIDWHKVVKSETD